MLAAAPRPARTSTGRGGFLAITDASTPQFFSASVTSSLVTEICEGTAGGTSTPGAALTKLTVPGQDRAPTFPAQTAHSPSGGRSAQQHNNNSNSNNGMQHVVSNTPATQVYGDGRSLHAPADQCQMAVDGSSADQAGTPDDSTSTAAVPSVPAAVAVAPTPVAVRAPSPGPPSAVGGHLPAPALALVSSALLASGGAPPAVASHGAHCTAGGAGAGVAGGSPAVSSPEMAAALAAAVAASKLGLTDQLRTALATVENLAHLRDAEGRTCLHYAAGYGNEECVDLLLAKAADTTAQDANGDVPLHFAAIHGHPMCAYNIGKAGCAACLVRNKRGQTPVDVAVACERGEVLNAMLLACAGDASDAAVRAMRKLLADGAVPDTWAPNGSSALMLAASVDGTAGLQVLLAAGASIELQDALGRSALMFAAGNCAHGALVALLDAGACMSLRDRRGRSVLDYAPDGSAVRATLEARLRALEAVAQQLQDDLLASLAQPGKGGTGGVVGKSSSRGNLTTAATGAGSKKGKKAGKGSVTPPATAAPVLAVVLAPAPLTTRNVQPCTALPSEAGGEVCSSTPASPTCAADDIGSGSASAGEPDDGLASSADVAVLPPPASTTAALAVPGVEGGAGCTGVAQPDPAANDAATSAAGTSSEWQVVEGRSHKRAPGSAAAGAPSAPGSVSGAKASGGRAGAGDAAHATGGAGASTGTGRGSRAGASDLARRAACHCGAACAAAPAAGEGMVRHGSGHSLSSLGSCDSHALSHASSSSYHSRQSHAPSTLSHLSSSSGGSQNGAAAPGVPVVAVVAAGAAPPALPPAVPPSTAPLTNAWTARRAAQQGTTTAPAASGAVAPTALPTGSAFAGPQTSAAPTPLPSVPPPPQPVKPAVAVAPAPPPPKSWANTLTSPSPSPAAAKSQAVPSSVPATVPVTASTTADTATASVLAPASVGVSARDVLLRGSGGKATTGTATPPKPASRRGSAPSSRAPSPPPPPPSARVGTSTAADGGASTAAEPAASDTVPSNDSVGVPSAGNQAGAAEGSSPVLSSITAHEPAVSAPPAPVSADTAVPPALGDAMESSQTAAATPGCADAAQGASAASVDVAALLAERDSLRARVSDLEKQLHAATAHQSGRGAKGAGGAGAQAKDTLGPAAQPTVAQTTALQAIKQAVYSERLRIVSHFLNLGMSPSALITLLSPLSTGTSGTPDTAATSAPDNGTELGAAGGVPELSGMPDVKAPTPAVADKSGGGSAGSSGGGTATGATGARDPASTAATGSVAPLEHAPLEQRAPAARAPNATPAEAPAGPELAVCTPVAGLMSSRPSSLDSTPAKPSHEPPPLAPAPAPVLKPLPAGSEAAPQLPRQVTALEAARAARAASAARAAAPAAPKPGPRTAAEAAAAFAALQRLARQQPVVGPAVPVADVAERLSQICRAVPPAAPSVGPGSGCVDFARRLSGGTGSGGVALGACELERAPTLSLPGSVGMPEVPAAACFPSSAAGGRAARGIEPADEELLRECGDVSGILLGSDGEDDDDTMFPGLSQLSEVRGPPSAGRPASTSGCIPTTTHCPVMPRRSFEVSPGGRRSGAAVHAHHPSADGGVLGAAGADLGAPRTSAPLFAFPTLSVGSQPVSIPPTSVGESAPAGLPIVKRLSFHAAGSPALGDGLARSGTGAAGASCLDSIWSRSPADPPALHMRASLHSGNNGAPQQQQQPPPRQGSSLRPHASVPYAAGSPGIGCGSVHGYPLGGSVGHASSATRQAASSSVSRLAGATSYAPRAPSDAWAPGPGAGCGSQPLVSVLGFTSQPRGGVLPPRADGSSDGPGLGGERGASPSGSEARSLLSCEVTAAHTPGGRAADVARPPGGANVAGGAAAFHAPHPAPSTLDVEVSPRALRHSQACRSGLASPFGTSPPPGSCLEAALGGSTVSSVSCAPGGAASGGEDDGRAPGRRTSVSGAAPAPPPPLPALEGGQGSGRMSAGGSSTALQGGPDSPTRHISLFMADADFLRHLRPDFSSDAPVLAPAAAPPPAMQSAARKSLGAGEDPCLAATGASPGSVAWNVVGAGAAVVAGRASHTSQTGSTGRGSHDGTCYVSAPVLPHPFFQQRSREGSHGSPLPSPSREVSAGGWHSQARGSAGGWGSAAHQAAQASRLLRDGAGLPAAGLPDRI